MVTPLCHTKKGVPFPRCNLLRSSNEDGGRETDRNPPVDKLVCELSSVWHISFLRYPFAVVLK